MTNTYRAAHFLTLDGTVVAKTTNAQPEDRSDILQGQDNYLDLLAGRTVGQVNDEQRQLSHLSDEDYRAYLAGEPTLEEFADSQADYFNRKEH